MAAGTYTITRDVRKGRSRTIQIKAIDGDVNYIVDAPNIASLAVQVTGTPDGATVAIQRAVINLAANFAALATALSFAAPGQGAVAVGDLGYPFYRILISGGGVNQDLDVAVHITER